MKSPKAYPEMWTSRIRWFFSPYSMSCPYFITFSSCIYYLVSSCYILVLVRSHGVQEGGILSGCIELHCFLPSNNSPEARHGVSRLIQGRASGASVVSSLFFGI